MRGRQRICKERLNVWGPLNQRIQHHPTVFQWECKSRYLAICFFSSDSMAFPSCHYCPLKRWQDGIAAGALKRRHFRSNVVLGPESEMYLEDIISHPWTRNVQPPGLSHHKSPKGYLRQDRCWWRIPHIPQSVTFPESTSLLMRGQVADKGKTKNITAFIDEEEEWGQCLGRWL